MTFTVESRFGTVTHESLQDALDMVEVSTRNGWPCRVTCTPTNG